MRAGRALGDVLSEEGSSRRVPRAALVLGLAGLLPAIAELGLLVATRAAPGRSLSNPIAAFAWERWALPGAYAELGYAALILSFLGGMWWGLASRVAASPALYLAAVTPTLVTILLVGLVTLSGGETLWPMFLGIGGAIIATLPIDNVLTRHHLAPSWWMWLRAPLSLTLGSATILIGILTIG